MFNQQNLQKARQAISQKHYQQAHSICIGILQTDPTVAEAYFLLAIIAIEHKNYIKAEDILRRAIRFDEGCSTYYAYQAQCLIMLNRHSDSLTALERAVTLGSDDSLVLDTIGVVYSRLGYHDKAVKFFESAIARQPNNASFQYNLASSLQFSGKFERAEAAYEAAIKIDPLHFRSHSSLSQLRKQQADNNHIERLRKAYEQLSGNVDATLHICHALSKELEDLGEHQKAFEYLSEGNNKKHQQINYTPEQDRKLFSSLINTFHAGNPLKQKAGYDSIEPIFIIGMPRTGTTLVERILSNHSDVFSAGELTNFALQLKKMVGTSSNLVLDPETLHKGLEVDPRRLGEAYVASTRPRTGSTPRFIDKMPLNFFYVPFIRAALPNAKIICLRRNPLDTCLSNYRQLFSTSFSYYNYAYRLIDTAHYYIQFARLMELWESLFKSNFYQVNYEQIVLNSEAEARKLLKFCQLDWQPQCLDFETNLAPVATASSVQVRNKIYTSAVNRWQRYDEFLGEVKALFEQSDIEY